MNKRQNNDVLLELLDVGGKRVLDVGCGTGGLVRLMTAMGAKAVGVECGQKPLDKARAAPVAGGETYVEGFAEDLPFEDACFDIVVLFNTLHHIGRANQAKTLAEAARVLKAGGLVYVAEPLADGANFELGKPLVDETDIRAAAYGAVKEARAYGLEEIREVTYSHKIRHRDFAEFRDSKITVDVGRREAFDEKADQLNALFERLGSKEEDGMAFDQPMRINLLGKEGG
ncbi:MAG TPA: class I SAM-dependent methyltransferase [Rhodospirillales bacterium]|jgi:hypothetical protein|nr:class I SAM-dependent methyltransferase [Rhodospirillales bacterium]